MSFFELLLILVVALWVFEPKKIPMLVNHARHVLAQWMKYKTRWNQFWQQQLAQYHLDANVNKAKNADAKYDR